MRMYAGVWKPMPGAGGFLEEGMLMLSPER